MIDTEHDTGPSAAAYVYEVYDADPALIYVGATRDVFARLQEHQHDAWWFDQLHRVRAQVLPSWQAATTEEARRIRELRPKWNLKGLPPRREWDADQFITYLTAKTCRDQWERARGRRSSPLERQGVDRHLDLVRSEFARRFGYWPTPQLRALPPLANELSETVA